MWLAGLASIGAPAAAQLASGPASANWHFFTAHDAEVLGAGLIVSAALSPFDVRIARWVQSTSVQGSKQRNDFARHVTKINETTLTLAGLVVYGTGRLTNQRAMADIGLHTTESIVLTSVVSQLIRGPLGRSRPSYTHHTNQYDFHFMKGFGEFTYRAFPSLHSATAYAAGSALVGEVRERHRGSLWYATPLIYGAASLPGLSRMYLDQHWASDVVMGGVVGILLGSKVVNYSHARPSNPFDHALLGAQSIATKQNRFSIGLSRRF